VAECNKEETGVGPSMASGNQVCNNNCADLAKAATHKQKANKDDNEIISVSAIIILFSSTIAGKVLK